MRRRRLLFLCQTFPYPPDGGVWIRSFNVLRLLAREYDVSLLAFERAVLEASGFTYDLDADISRLSEIAGSVEVFRIPQRHSRVRFFADHLRSTVLQRPFTRYLYRSAGFRSRLEQLLRAEAIDVVHVDSLDLSEYLPLVHGLPTVCTHHNVESELLRRRARIESRPVHKAYFRLQAHLTRREEQHWCPRVDLNVAVSDQDAAKLRELAPQGRYEVVPNGVDVDHFRPGEGDGRGVVFVGGTNWFPNRDALEYFGAEILPLIRRVLPDLPVTWVGAASKEDRIQSQQRYGISLTGYVDDVRPHVQGAACYVVPLRVGGGSRLKILDAWAMGMPIVSTAVGAEGLAARQGDNILIADRPEEFADAVLRVLRDDALRRRLGKAARQTAELDYSWDAIGRRMLPLYEEVVNRAAAQRSRRTA